MPDDNDNTFNPITTTNVQNPANPLINLGKSISVPMKIAPKLRLIESNAQEPAKKEPRQK